MTSLVRRAIVADSTDDSFIVVSCVPAEVFSVVWEEEEKSREAWPWQGAPSPGNGQAGASAVRQGQRGRQNFG